MSRTILRARDTLGMILAGGRVNELAALTLHRPKSAIPFGGIYRVIDCALTNLSSSGVNRVGVLSQYRPYSLMDHVRDGRYWDLHGFQRGVSILPPHTGESNFDWYKGTADALYQNISFIKNHKKALTLIVSGDHIYRMDYNALFDIHHRTGANMTMAVTPVPVKSASRYGLAEIDSNDMVTGYSEKPDKPTSYLASMTVFLFDTQVLIDELTKNAKTGTTFQLYDEILPAMVERNTVAAYRHEGYWAYSRSLEDYYRSNMDCLGENPAADLKSWNLYTNHDSGRIGDPPPILTGNQSQISNSLVSPGCKIMGKVFNSVLSPGVIVEKDAEIHDSIILDKSTVHAGSIVRRSIIDKGTAIMSRAIIGKSEQKENDLIPNRDVPELLHSGLTIIGKNALIPEKMKIGTNVIIYPETKEFNSLIITDGTTVFPE